MCGVKIQNVALAHSQEGDSLCGIGLHALFLLQTN